MSLRALEHRLAELLDAIERAPLIEGLAPCVRSHDPAGTIQSASCASVFPSALVLHALPPDTSIRQPLADALWRQQNTQGSWNYWRRESEDASREPYPDDLDTTCCVLSALAAADPTRVDGDLLARVTMLLLIAERHTGGPYRTWLVPPDAPEVWKDVDPAVNANIGRFLHGQGVTLPNLNRYIAEYLMLHNAQSPYYPSPIATFYFLSSWYRGEGIPEALRDITERQHVNGSWGTPLETAWAVTTLLRWKESMSAAIRGVDFLLQQPIKTLAQPSALCVHRIAHDHREYIGSPLVTLTACQETLLLWQHHMHSRTGAVSTQPPPTRSPYHPRHDAILTYARARITAAPPPLRALVQERVNAIATSDVNPHIQPVSATRSSR